MVFQTTGFVKPAGAVLAIVTLIVAGRPAGAQTYLQPPEYKQVDKNGVDLLSGAASFSVKLGSIGSGDGELSYLDFWLSGGVSNNLNNTLAFILDQKTERYSVSVGFNNSSRTFVENSDGSYTLLRGEGDTLVALSSGIYQHTMKDGEVRNYGVPSGATLTYLLLLSRVLPNGVTWTYDWQVTNGFSRPLAVTNNLGYKITLSYLSNTSPSYSDLDNLNNWIFVQTVGFYNVATSSSALATATRSTSSGVTQMTTDGGQNWSVSGNAGAPSGTTSTTAFTVKTPSSSSMNYSYTPVSPVNAHLTTSATINGITYNYDFGMSGATSGTTTVTDPLSGTTTVNYTNYQGKFSSAAFPTSVTDALGNVTSYTNISGYLITSVTYPSLGKSVISYDARNNITLITHKAAVISGVTTPADITESAVFPSSCSNPITCNRPTSMTDKNGNTTSYTYDPTHGGLLIETLPADANGVNPVKRYHYAHRYAWILNGTGGYMQSATQVWLKDEERTCRTTATSITNNNCAGGSADEVVTTYDYGPDSGPNNLLLRGVAVAAGGQTLRTCFTYDAKGNKLSETKPLGTGSTCP